MFKTYVQCRSCGAKWQSPNFVECKELKDLILWGPCENGTASTLLRKKFPITFWQNLDMEQLEKEQIFGTCDRCGKPILTGSTYWYDKTTKSLPDKKFCSEQCFSEALAEQIQPQKKPSIKAEMISAPVIVGNPEVIDKIENKYQIIFDQALTYPKFDNLNQAINIMAQKGWKCVNITSLNVAAGFKGTATFLYALMEK